MGQCVIARTLLQETVAGLDPLICVTLGKGPHCLIFKEGGGEDGKLKGV